jgi:polyhydroxyalkanoate synthesis regulator phasin
VIYLTFAEKKERELAHEINNTTLSTERMKNILTELDLVRNVGKMTLEEKKAWESELSERLTSDSFTAECGKTVYSQLDILRNSKY